MGAGNVTGRLHGFGKFLLIFREPEALLTQRLESIGWHIKPPSDRLGGLYNTRSGDDLFAICKEVTKFKKASCSYRSVDHNAVLVHVDGFVRLSKRLPCMLAESAAEFIVIG